MNTAVNQHRHIVRKPLRPPPLAALPNGLISEVLAAQNITALKRLSFSRSIFAAPDVLEGLHDPLSPAFMTLHGPKKIKERYTQERELLAYVISELGSAERCCKNSGVFSNCLEQMIRQFKDFDDPWRRDKVFLYRGGVDVQVEFPPASAVSATVNAAFRSYFRCPDRLKLLGAIYCYVLILNAHPFKDGNGRVSRVLFNWLLKDLGVAPNEYLPISHFMEQAAGGYELAIRRAELHANWKPIIGQFLTMLKIACSSE